MMPVKFQYPSSRVILPDLAKLLTSSAFSEFQYPSSRVILPDTLSKTPLRLGHGFQYPSSRVILPDFTVTEEHFQRGRKSFNTPVVG